MLTQPKIIIYWYYTQEIYGQVYSTYNREDFLIGKYTELNYLYIDYARQIDQILIVALLFKNDKSFIKLKYFMMNIYS